MASSVSGVRALIVPSWTSPLRLIFDNKQQNNLRSVRVQFRQVKQAPRHNIKFGFL
jgi:hypothetical protein